MDDSFELYREQILDHARSPRHWGLLEPADFDHEESNPLCGDHLHLTLRVDENGVIQDVGWDGRGCAISQASASMFGETLIGRPLADAAQTRRETILDLIGFPLTPNRMKCALLSLKVVVIGAAGKASWERIEDDE